MNRPSSIRYSIDAISSRCKQILHRQSFHDSFEPDQSLTYSQGHRDQTFEKDQSMSKHLRSQDYSGSCNISNISQAKETSQNSSIKDVEDFKKTKRKQTNKKRQIQNSISFKNSKKSQSKNSSDETKLNINVSKIEEIKNRYAQIKQNFQYNNRLITQGLQQSNTESIHKKIKTKNEQKSNDQSSNSIQKQHITILRNHLHSSKKNSSRKNTSRQYDQTFSIDNSSSFNQFCKDLKQLKNAQLVQLLLQQIQENQKNKHAFEDKKKELDTVKQNLSNCQQILSDKKMHLSVLLETQRKNLFQIQQLKSKLKTVPLVQSSSSKKNQQDITFNNESKFYQSKNNNNDLLQKQIYVLRQKYKKLQNYMNEYIQNTDQAYKQYRKNLNNQKEAYSDLKHEFGCLQKQMELIKMDKNQLIKQVQLKTRDLKSVQRTMENSRSVIKQLQTQFIELKEENNKLVQELSKLNKQKEQLNAKVSQLLEQSHQYSEQNYLLQKRNDELNDEIVQIRQNIMKNQTIEAQVKHICDGLTQQIKALKSKIQNVNDELCNQRKQKIIEQQKLKDSLLSIKELQIKLEKSDFQHQKALLDLTQQKQLEIKRLQQVINHLQDNISDMQNVQQELLEEYQLQREKKQKLKIEMLDISKKVIILQNTYQNEVNQNSKIKAQLQNFWNNSISSSSANQIKYTNDQNTLKQSNVSKTNKNNSSCGDIRNSKQLSSQASRVSLGVTQNVSHLQQRTNQRNYINHSGQEIHHKQASFRNSQELDLNTICQKISKKTPIVSNKMLKIQNILNGNINDQNSQPELYRQLGQNLHRYQDSKDYDSILSENSYLQKDCNQVLQQRNMNENQNNQHVSGKLSKQMHRVNFNQKQNENR